MEKLPEGVRQALRAELCPGERLDLALQPATAKTESLRRRLACWMAGTGVLVPLLILAGLEARPLVLPVGLGAVLAGTGIAHSLLEWARSRRVAYAITTQRCFEIRLTRGGIQVRDLECLPGARLDVADQARLRDCLRASTHLRWVPRGGGHPLAAFAAAAALKGARPLRGCPGARAPACACGPHARGSRAVPGRKWRWWRPGDPSGAASGALPARLRAAVERMVAPGETLLWAGRPTAGEYLRHTSLDAISFLLVSGAALASLVGIGAVAVAGAPDPPAVGALPALLGPLGGWAAAAGWLWRRVTGTVYAVTDRGGFILTPGSKVIRFSVRDLRRFYRIQNGAGRGNLTPPDGPPGVGFYGVRDVKDVDDLIKGRQLRDRSSELIPAQGLSGHELAAPESPSACRPTNSER